MFRTAIAVFLIALPCQAAPQQHACALKRGDSTVSLRFTFDRDSFAPPLSPDDPPRRQVATVALSGQTLQAEALLMQTGEIGFVLPSLRIMLLAAPDGSARMSEGDRLWQGRCTADQ